MSALKSLGNLLAATVAAGVMGALALAPAAGITGAAIARTDAAMQTNLADMTDGTAPGVTTITDVDGNPMAWLYSQRRYEVNGDQISQTVKDALVSVEDRRFYEHEGVDLQGTARALITNLAAGGVAEGASTINQQYVKNHLLLVDAKTEEEQARAIEQSIPRKLREMRMASELDKILTKDEILTRYLNIVPFGNGAYGIEAASQTYFGIPAAELNVPQGAMLAGIVQSSSYLDPYNNPDGVLERRNTVLQTMVSTGRLTQEDADRYAAEPLGVLEEPRTLPNGCIAAGDRGFFCDYALTYLEAKGISLDDLKHGAYTIRTTLDPAVQDAARDALADQVDPMTQGVAGVMNVLRPGADSRDILAMASSRHYGLNLENGETVLPQPSSMVGYGAGSIFKVFTAAAALEDGIGLDTVLDVPTRYEAKGLGEGGAENCPPKTYCVENAGQYRPQMSLRDALAHSPNTPFVKLIEDVGVPKVVDISVRLGLRSLAVDKSYNEEYSIADYFKAANLGSYTLGPISVNPLELANVGATLASGGRWCEPNPIASITDRNGQELYLERPACENALDSEVADALADGLSEDAIKGTAANAASAFGWSAPLAAKTGTTENHQSASFLGFNSGIAAAPYIYNDGTNTAPLCTSPARQCPEGSMYGGTEPARIFFEAANRIPAATEGAIPEASSKLEKGKTQEFVEQLRGLTEADARKKAEGAGYKVTTQIVRGNGRPRGQVVDARNANGSTFIKEGDTISLQISDGSPAPVVRPEPEERDDPENQFVIPGFTQEDIDRFNEQLRDALGRP